MIGLVSFFNSTGVILERVPWLFCRGFYELPAIRYEELARRFGLGQRPEALDQIVLYR